MNKLAFVLLVILLLVLESCSALNRKYNLDVDVCVFKDEIGIFYCPVKNATIAQDKAKNDFVIISIDDLNEMIEELKKE